MSGAEPGAKISLALGGPKKSLRPAPTNGVKRSHASLHDEDDEDHEDVKTQTVSHFDKAAGGAIDQAKPKIEKGPLIIAPQSNRDWKEASKRKRKKNGLPGEAGGKGVDAAALEAKEAASKPGYGLNIYKKSGENVGTNEDETISEEPQQSDTETNGETSAKPRTADEEAIDELLGKTAKSELVLPAVTEEEAFQRDFDTAPDMATLDDYARVPVEQFGAALLRGMGWKEGQGIGSERGKKSIKTKVPERRPALLGIGAKPEAAVAEEMGTWGKGAKRGAEIKIYNPVLLRDKKTGEMFTEEELQKKKERAEREQYELEFEQKEKEKERKRRRDDEPRDSNRDRKDRDRRRDRDRKDDRDQRSDRDRDRKDDRGQRSDKDRDRRDDKDRDRERRRRDDSDEEYYRRKEKDRRKREHDGGDHDRERSRRHDSDRERNRDRDHRRDHDRDRRR